MEQVKSKNCPICGTVMRRCPDKYYAGFDGGAVREDEIEWECPKCEGKIRDDN